jgi:hypothetical protein
MDMPSNINPQDRITITRKILQSEGILPLDKSSPTNGGT